MQASQPSATTGNSITEGVIWQQILLFFFPILFGTFFQQLYNTADAVIVGNLVGKEALAAVGGTTGTLTNLFVGFFIGLSSGATVIISQYYGAGKEKLVSQTVHTAVAFSIAAGLVMTATGFLGAPLMLRAMGSPDDVTNQAVPYIRIYFTGMVFNLLYNMGAGILRAIGDSKRPLYFLIASCLTNIVLDLLFVAIFHMGVRGAALATILSQVVSALLVLSVLSHTKDCYHLDFHCIRIDPQLLARIVRVGFPAGLQSAMYSVSNIIIQASVNALGTNTIAAWTAYGKIDSLYWMMINAFGISITTFVGQNYGAHKEERIRRGIRVCLGLSLSATIIICSLLYVFGKYVLHLFNSDPEVLSIGMDILHYMVPTFVTYILIEIYSGSLRGIGDCWIPMMITCLGVCVLRAIWVLGVVPFHHNIFMVMFSYPFSWVVTSSFFFFYMHCFSRFKKGGNLFTPLS